MMMDIRVQKARARKKNEPGLKPPVKKAKAKLIPEPVVESFFRDTLKRAPENQHTFVNNIPLLPENPVALKNAIAVLNDPNKLKVVFDSTHISHYAFVGNRIKDVVFHHNRVCHSAVPYQLRAGKNGGQKYMWRYMVQYANPQLKGQYNGNGNEPFTDEQQLALDRWYDWLRNRSFMSRAFVGPKDIETLRKGSIIDLSMPSAVVHLAAVAYRISGEFPEVVYSWDDLCRCGIDPNIAFGMAQNRGGFGTDGAIQYVSSRGHNLISGIQKEALARFAYGVVDLYTHSAKPSYESYDIMCNQAWRGKDKDGDWDEKLEGVDLISEEYKDFFGNVCVGTIVPASAFANPWSPGMLSLYKSIEQIADGYNWFPKPKVEAPVPVKKKEKKNVKPAPALDAIQEAADDRDHVEPAAAGFGYGPAVVPVPDGKLIEHQAPPMGGMPDPYVIGHYEN